VRTLAITAVVVPLMVFLLLPGLQRVLAPWVTSASPLGAGASDDNDAVGPVGAQAKRTGDPPAGEHERFAAHCLGAPHRGGTLVVGDPLDLPACALEEHAERARAEEGEVVGMNQLDSEERGEEIL
jgi:hypothetical protein